MIPQASAGRDVSTFENSISCLQQSTVRQSCRQFLRRRFLRRQGPYPFYRVQDLIATDLQIYKAALRLDPSHIGNLVHFLPTIVKDDFVKLHLHKNDALDFSQRRYKSQLLRDYSSHKSDTEGIALESEAGETSDFGQGVLLPLRLNQQRALEEPIRMSVTV